MIHRMLVLIRAWFTRITAIVLLFIGGSCVAQTIVVAHGAGQFYPREYILNGKLEGLHEDIISNTAKSLGITIDYRSLPWKRAIKALEYGEIDALMYLGKTPKREAFAHFNEGNVLSLAHFRPIILAKNRSKIRFDGSLDSLRNCRVAVGVDYYYGEPFDSAFFIHKVSLESPSSSLLANLLLLGRIDVIIYDVNTLKTDLSAEFVKQHFFAYPHILSSNQYYLAFSKRKHHDDFAKRFAAAALAYKASDAYQQQLQYYGLEH